MNPPPIKVRGAVSHGGPFLVFLRGQFTDNHDTRLQVADSAARARPVFAHLPGPIIVFAPTDIEVRGGMGLFPFVLRLPGMAACNIR
jgi:hypothetical protein